MDAPTLTLPEGTFRFERSNDRAYYGHGNWIVVRARSGDTKPGTIVCTSFAQDLTTLAKECGIPEVHNYVRVPPKPEKTKAVRIPREKGPKVTPGLLGGFNPFAKAG